MMYRKMILETSGGAFAGYLNGVFVDYYPTRMTAEQALNKMIYELLTPTTTRPDRGAATEEAPDA